jgi:uroporphyrinogen decarboxylase
MKPRDRVHAALQRQEPDRVPYCELGVDRAMARKLLAWGGPDTQEANLESNTYSIDEAKQVASFLHLDNICYVLRAPVYAKKEPGRDGRLFYAEGLIQSEADLDMLVLPDPHDDALYVDAEAYLRQKEDYSAWLVTRAGIFPTILGMGLEHFSMALYDNRPLIETILDRYFDWVVVVAERVCSMGFDAFVTTDDVAFKTAPFFSPEVFHELVLPRYQRLAEAVSLPWIFHSDGNIMPFVDDLVDVGISGMHPIEDGAMDIREVKQTYGDRLCLLGNVNLNLLGLGKPEEVDHTVGDLIRDVGPGGGYIVTSGNSLAGYLEPDNVVAMSEAVRKYGRYPIEN